MCTITTYTSLVHVVCWVLAPVESRAGTWSAARDGNGCTW